MDPEILSQDLLSQGLQLMFTGMGTVFSFLVFLVLVTRFMSFLVARLQPATGIYAQLARQNNIDEEMLEAIAEAIAQHRARENK